MTADKTHAGKYVPWFRTSAVPVFLLLLVVSTAAFWRCVALPFIQDDWALLRASQTQDVVSLLRSFFDFRGALFYRPAGLTYVTLLFKVFGETAWPCHVLAMCIHLLNGWLVLCIMKRLTENQLISVICGLIYASAFAIHLDPLCWAVGIYDLGGAFFFFAAIALYLSGRTWSAVLSFFVGTLFKEATIVLPAVLTALETIRVPQGGRKDFKSLIWRLLPFYVLCAFIVAVRMSTGTSPSALPASHPYVLEPFGRHVVENAYRYFAWMLQAFIPFGSIHTRVFRYVLLCLALLAVVVVFQRSGRTPRLLGGLSLWMLFSLLPVLFLPNHSYRYYATYALPPFICVVLILVAELLELIRIRRRRDLLLAFGGTLIILAAVVQSNRVFRQGLDYRTLSDGTNELIRRAAFVDVVRSSLLQQLPSPAAGTTIHLRGVELWSFNKDSGPQVWYNSGSLHVYDLADLRYTLEGFHVANPIQSQTDAYTGARGNLIDVDDAKIFAFQLSGGRLQAVPPAELRAIAEMQTAASAGPGTVQQ